MTRAFTAPTFSQAVKDAQLRYVTREFCTAVEAKDPPNDVLTELTADYIRGCDSFVIGTSSREGWPHVQHRGGPKGFLRILDPRTLAFADYAGNKQYITVGNLAENDRVFLFLLDYRQRRRLKIWGRGEAVEGDHELLARVEDPRYQARIERVIRVRVEAWDFNCRQHIPRRYADGELPEVAAEYERRLVALQDRYDATLDLLFSHE